MKVINLKNLFLLSLLIIFSGCSFFYSPKEVKKGGISLGLFEVDDLNSELERISEEVEKTPINKRVWGNFVCYPVKVKNKKQQCFLDRIAQTRIVANSLFINTQNNVIYKLNTDTGVTEWVLEAPCKSLKFTFFYPEDITSEIERVKENIEKSKEEIEKISNDEKLEEDKKKEKIKAILDRIETYRRYLEELDRKNLVYFIDKNYFLFAINHRYGEIESRRSLQYIPVNLPLVSSTKLFLPTMDKYRLYVLDLSNLTVDYFIRFNSLFSFAPRKIQGRYFYITEDGMCQAYSDLGDKLWSFQANDKITGIEQYKNFILLSSYDFNLYALSIETGRLSWLIGFGEPITSIDFIWNDFVFISSKKNIYAVKLDYFLIDTIPHLDGKLIWQIKNIGKPIFADKKYLYLRNYSDKKKITMISLNSGTLVHEFSLPDFSEILWEKNNEKVFFLTYNGFVLSYSLK